MNTTNYKQKDYETIFKEMLTDSYTEGLLSNDEHFMEYISNRQDIENNLVMSMSIYALKDSKQYEDMTKIYLSNDLDYAVGDDLDILGEKCATYRPGATKSSVELVFSIKTPVDYDITIPANTVVYNADGLTYATVQDCTIIRGEFETKAGALSTLYGGSGRAEPLTLNYCETLGDGITVTNPKGSSGTHEAYTDNEYRQLLRNWTYSHIRGTKEAYDEFFASYDGLDDYRLIPRWDGTGTLKIIINPNDDWLKNDLYKKLQEKTFLLLEDVYITGAIERPLDIDCTINVDIDQIVEYSSVDYDNIKQLVEKALAVYVNGGYRRDGTYYKGLGIGQDFIPFKAGIFINEEIPEIMSIDWKDTLKRIDNIINYDEFIEYDPNTPLENTTVKDYKIHGVRGQRCKTEPLYVNYPYLVESDNEGFTIKFMKEVQKTTTTGEEITVEEEMFSTKQSSFRLENFDFYGGWIELTASRDNSTISYIKLYTNGDSEEQYNTHICINGDEKAVLRDCVVRIQGEDKPKC